MVTTHIVTAGDCISSIAARYGFRDWRAVYDHPDNAELKKKRPNPSVLLPGDKVAIPDREPKEEPCATGEKHRFQVRSPRTRLELALLDADQEPIAGKRYELVIDGTKHEGQTDGEGKIDRPIPGDASSGELALWLVDDEQTEPSRWTLKLGQLDPVDTPTGIQERLQNLGFDCGPVDGVIGKRTRAAVRAFQIEHELVVDGDPGPKTQAKLEQAHGS